MKIIIEEQIPDGINISVEDLIVDTVEEANEFTTWINKIWGSRKIDLEECKRIYEKHKDDVGG